MAYQFDLNVRLEDGDDGNLPFGLNDPVMEDHGNVCFHFLLQHSLHVLSLTFFFLHRDRFKPATR